MAFQGCEQRIQNGTGLSGGGACANADAALSRNVAMSA
jgi:hypothetical protein